MSRPRTITHVYRLADGWSKVPHEPVSEELVQRLRDEGVTMIRARRGFFDEREISLSTYSGR